MNWNPEQLRDDFLIVAKLGGIKIQRSDICIDEIPRGRHEKLKDLPKGKTAVYVFSYKERFLKVGRVGPRSQARYKSQHYNPCSSRSNLAKSLLKNESAARDHCLTVENVGGWIKDKTDRVNFILEVNVDKRTSKLLEAFAQCRLKPIFEGPNQSKRQIE